MSTVEKNISGYDERIKTCSAENQNIYNAWIKYCRGKKIPKASLTNYQSVVVSFFEIITNCSILSVKKDTIGTFIVDPSIKPTSRLRRKNHLTFFLRYVQANYLANWDFDIKELKEFEPSREEINQSKESKKAITASDICRLYDRFYKEIYINNNEQWLQIYTIFRLMYLGIFKEDIANIDEYSYDTKTGEIITLTGEIIKLDDELIAIFNDKGVNFLPHKASTVYDKVKKVEQVLGRRITQNDIQATRELFLLRCPQCGELVDNNANLFGCLRINLLNLGDTIVCKKCLENL